ncbi:MAG: pyruvate kinase [Anaerolineae bacterium]
MAFHRCTDRPRKRTKIVATIGPASERLEVLRRMILAGMDVARLNFSHGTPESHAAVIGALRQLSEELDIPVAILGDLRGPRIRVGEVVDGQIELTSGQTIVLTPETVLGNAQRISVTFPGLADDLQPGNLLLIDDGDVMLQVQRITPERDIHCVVLEGGSIASRRGINLPGIRVSLPALTDKDKEDVLFAVEQGVDFLALSFVQCVEDVRVLKHLLQEQGSDIPVIAKIEKKGALDDLSAIVHEAYGVMVARGDLALEMSFQEVPVAQKRIIAQCRAAAVPVITATQMLESMMERDHPTRAEATDIANAVFDGTDALMLSGETALGRYPVESVATMATIAARAEAAWLTSEVARPPELPPPGDVDATIAHLGHIAACDLKAAAIVTYTQSGSTARRLCRHRPPALILALTPSPATRRRLALSWGVTPLMCPPLHDLTMVSKKAVEEVQHCQLAHPGDVIVVLAGTPLGVPGTTNLLKVERVA